MLFLTQVSGRTTKI